MQTFLVTHAFGEMLYSSSAMIPQYLPQAKGGCTWGITEIKQVVFGWLCDLNMSDQEAILRHVKQNCSY